jgi:phenylpropionate dioxygenase-like ring-hydroxylating dioxygenase large terminal subunit
MPDAPDHRDPSTQPVLRGDPITGDRYWSPVWMEREWERVWTRVWHIAGRTRDLPEPGDFVVHNLRRESVLVVRQQDGSIKAFYNVCQHRGNRLVWAEAGGMPAFTCAYHGWRYGLDGTLEAVQDPDDFDGGNPCGRLRLKEVPCAVWQGFVWYSMDPEARPLLDWLDPIPRLLQNRDMESMIRVVHRVGEADTNWKFAPDNFNESYHLPSVHPQMAAYIDEDYRDTLFEMHPGGHNRMVIKSRPSQRLSEANAPDPLFDAIMQAWDLDPAAFRGRRHEARLAVQQQKRRLGPARGYHHFDRLADAELTDYFHHTLFPNVTITANPDGVNLFRTEPHPTDPNKCIFEYWFMVPPVASMAEIMTIAGKRPLVEAPLERVTSFGGFVDQDLGVAPYQQLGFHSRGYKDAVLSRQENRVRRFHEVLNDHIEGRR